MSHRLLPGAHHYALLFLVACLASVDPLPAWGQEAPPEATEDESDLAEESPYLDLRGSEDRSTSRLADRYFNLVKLQEWTDSTGKSRVVAKYVEHDPDLAWVKIVAVRGRGDDRVTKEISVPLAKLSKTCQSRVRQIDTLQKKLDELLTSSGDPTQAGDGDLGAPMQDEYGIDPERAGRPTPAVSTAAASQRPAPPRRPLPPRDGEPGFDPDPLGFAEVPIESTLPPTTTETPPS